MGMEIPTSQPKGVKCHTIHFIDFQKSVDQVNLGTSAFEFPSPSDNSPGYKKIAYERPSLHTVAEGEKTQFSKTVRHYTRLN